MLRKLQAFFTALSGLAFAITAGALLLKGDMHGAALWMIAAVLTRAPAERDDKGEA